MATRPRRPTDVTLNALVGQVGQPTGRGERTVHPLNVTEGTDSPEMSGAAMSVCGQALAQAACSLNPAPQRGTHGLGRADNRDLLLRASHRRVEKLAGQQRRVGIGEQDGDATDAALSWLDRVQEADGGWGQMAGYGTDPNSTALVLSSLIAVDQADSSRFADKSRTPLAALLSFQLGCEAPEADRGAFTFPGSNNAPNGFATAQALGVDTIGRLFVDVGGQQRKLSAGEISIRLLP